MKRGIVAGLIILLLIVAGLFFLLSRPRDDKPSPPPLASIPAPALREEVPPNITAPLLLVPGLLGSWPKNPDLIHEKAEIPDLRDWVLAEERFGYIMGNVFGHLKSRLSRNGYEQGKDLFPAPYDWRRSMADHRAIMDWIDHAKSGFKLSRNKTAEKVDIVAHSLGGLLVRSYVQSNEYRDDVRSLAIVGTPNFGAPDAYYTWSGGVVPPTSGIGFATFLKSNLEAMNKKIAPEKGRPLVAFIRKYTPSLRDLLPVALENPATEGYLFDWPQPGTTFFPKMNPMNQNQLLVSLNTGLGELKNRARVQFFLAGGTRTLEQVQVEAPGGAYGWEDGSPSRNQLHKLADGDGRVLLKPAVLSQIFPVVTAVSDHQGAVCAFTPDILRFLELPADDGDRCLSTSRKLQSALAVSMTTTSKAELILMDPSGREYGFRQADAPKWSTERYLYLLFANPQNGPYRFTVSAGAGTHHVFVNYVKEPLTSVFFGRTFEYAAEAKEAWNVEVVEDTLRPR